MMNAKTALGALLLVAGLSLALTPCTQAQTASLAGTVTDSTGASVPHTRIMAQNLATGGSRSTETDESGTYRITNLTPGLYDVRFHRRGFKTVLYTQVELSVDLVLTLDARLAPSGLTETVTVSGHTVAPVDLNDAQIGALVDSRQMTDLPLILRDPYQLIFLSPGVNQSNTLFGGISVNGARERSNNFLLDGTDNNDSDLGGFPKGLSLLNPETVQEFRVITNNYLPEFGRNTGAVIDIVTKQGTNNFHADAYWFGRYTVTSAKDFFAASRNDDPFVRNQFGYSVGGPIDKNKTFFFVNEDFQRFRTTVLNASIVPTSEFKKGIFTFQGQPVDVRTPGSQNNASGLPLDPTIQSILALYPPPNGAILDGARGILHFPSRSVATGDNVTARIDHDFSARQTLSARYTFNRYDDSSFHHTDFLSGLGATETQVRAHNIALRMTSSLGQTITNELRFGANRLSFPLTCSGVSLFDSLGGLDPVGRGRDYPLPGVAGFGCTLLGDSNGSTRASGTYTTGDNLSWVLGRHTVKTGVEFRDVYSNSINDFESRATQDFNVFSNTGFSATKMTGLEHDPTLQNLVWTLFGVTDFQTQAQFFNTAGTRTITDERGFRQREFNVFAQDSYKVFSNVTFSYGVRYEFNGVPVEVHNAMSTLLVSPSGPAPFTFANVRSGNGAVSLYQDDWKGIEPRIAAAWDPFKNGKTSVRAGYGIFHDRIFGQLIGLARGNPPLQMLETVPNFTFAPISFQPPLGNFTSSPVVSDCVSLLNCSPVFPFLIDRKLRLPYSQNWNFGIQREAYHDLLVEINYVGAKGTRLLRVVDGNPPQPSRVAALEKFCVPTNPQNTGFSTQTGQCDQSTLQFANLWLGALPPFPVLPVNAVNNDAFLQADFFTGIANSTYHALQANVTKRLSHGFAIQGAYTWSHAIDDASDPFVTAFGNQAFPRNSNDLRAERGNSDFDVTHRLVFNYTWELPVGRGRSHLKEGAVGKILEGWQVSGVSTFSSGVPFDIFTNVDTAHTGLSARPDVGTSVTPSPSADPRTQTGPPADFFSIAPFGRGGDLSRNRFRGPGMNNSDAEVTKQIGIRERVKVDLRFEFYNLFNRVQFTQPDNLLQDGPLFGHSTSEVRRPDDTTASRQIQFAVKLQF
jgi:carboxypeptidase family protein